MAWWFLSGRFNPHKTEITMTNKQKFRNAVRSSSLVLSSRPLQFCFSSKICSTNQRRELKNTSMWLATCSRQSCSKNSLHARNARYTRKTYLKAYYQRCRLLVMDFWCNPCPEQQTKANRKQAAPLNETFSVISFCFGLVHAPDKGYGFCLFLWFCFPSLLSAVSVVSLRWVEAFMPGKRCPVRHAIQCTQ